MTPIKTGYAELSFWHATADEDWTPRPALAGDVGADVAIVGAGFTGLWTAYYLAGARPDLSIVVLEKDVAGFGASGRAGGWLSAQFPASLATLAGMATADAARAQDRAMRAGVDEVLRVAAAEGIDAHQAKSGTVAVARNGAQLARARTEIEYARGWGHGPDRLAWLDQEQARARLNATDTVAATYTPDGGVLHPTRLVRGLARAVEARGVRIHEQTPVTAISAHQVTSPHGTVRADRVLRATEGYTGSLAGHASELIPVSSLVIATAPLPAAVWREIGLAEREAFTDHRHLAVYGQRTADDRLIFGGRGAPYHAGSRLRPSTDRDPWVFGRLKDTLVDMFPVLGPVEITHRWGGPLGIPRDWCASVGLDDETGLGWAGGYVGDGVTTANLAGRTLRDLVLGHHTDLTGLPWVGHRSPVWEAEPMRWLGVNAGLLGMTAADAEERLTQRPSMLARAIAPLFRRRRPAEPAPRGHV